MNTRQLLTILTLAGIVSLGGVGQVFAQPAQVVQLPTFNFFTVSTTVSAPDRGAIALGGVRSLREGSNTRGIPMLSKLPGLSRLGKNRGIGREASASMLTLHPTIIDREEMEAALMADAASRVTEPAMMAFHESLREAARLSRGMAGRGMTASPPLTAAASPAPPGRSTPPGLAEIRRRNAVAKRAELDEAMQFFRRGEAALEEGKPGVAKIYFKIAGRQGDENLQRAVVARLRQIEQQSQQQR